MPASNRVKAAALAAMLVAAALVAGACQEAPTRPAPAPTSTSLPTPTPAPSSTPVVLLVTREVVREIAVTVTPSPTPHYVSRVQAPPGTLLYPLPGEVQSVDPQTAAGDAPLLVISQIYEDLFDLKPDGSLAPAAATGYQRSATSQVYTVTLRSGLSWSTGQGISARDYVSGTCRLLSPATGNPRKALLTAAAHLSGAAEFASGAEPDCAKVGIQAVDARTLRLTLEQPLPSFPQLLTQHLFLPAPPPDSLPILNAPAADQATTSAPSSGPYMLAQWQPGRRVVLLKNPNYWDAANVDIARIEMPVVPDAIEQLQAYKAGDLHVAKVPGQAVSQAQSDSIFNSELLLLPLPGTSFLGFNTAVTPTSDVNFRRALAAALNPRALLRDVLHEPWHHVATRLVPPGMSGAEEALANGGAVTSTVSLGTQQGQAELPAGRPVITLWTNREGHNEALAEGIATALERAGVHVRLVISTWDVFHHSLEECRNAANASSAGNAASAGTVQMDCNYNLYLAGWLADSPDAGRILGPTAGTAPPVVYSNWQAAEYGNLLSQAGQASNASRRAELYGQAEHMLLDQAVVLPLFYYDQMVAVKPGVTYDFPEFGPPVFKNWRLTR